MAYTSEIDKLERRHRENPEGRTFAPLADAYRKAGDVPRALEVLKVGLLLHPDYLSASIVLGRCHLDLGDLVAAEAAFRRVLDLDKENVIAIKALADITERLTRFDEAEHWLNYLLSIDSSNEDARHQLTRLHSARLVHAEQVSLATFAPEPDPSVEEEDELEPNHVGAPAGPVRTVEISILVADAPPESARTEEVDAVRSREPAPMVGLEDNTHQQEESELLVSKDERGHSGETGLDLERESDSLTPTVEVHLDIVGVERHEEIVLRPSSTSEYQVPSDADLLGGARSSGGFPRSFEESAPPPPVEPPVELPDGADEAVASAGWQSHQENDSSSEEPEPEPGARGAAAEATTQAWTSPAPEPEPEPEPSPVAAAPAMSMEENEEDEGALDEEARSSQEVPVVTETIGDVYAAQGHRVEALEVYRQLLLRSPDDARLQEKIDQLDRTSQPAASRGFAAKETGGQSVSSYFGDLLSARLTDSSNGSPADASGAEGDPAATSTGYMEEAFATDNEAAGEPTRPASGPLSLSAIFGEDSSPVPPVVSGVDGEAGSKAPGSHFDEFFGERPAAPAGSTRTRSVRLDADSDDLDQFHKWLKGLKR